MADTHQLIQELLGTTCRCGATKEARQTFCKRCYFKLPKDLQRRLYRRVGEGYEPAYAESAEFLDGIRQFHTGGATAPREREGSGGKAR